MKIKNYIKINGKYVPQEEIPEKEMEVIRKEMAIRLARGFGFVPVENTVERK